jgi:predicted exporter
MEIITIGGVTLTGVAKSIGAAFTPLLELSVVMSKTILGESRQYALVGSMRIFS